VSKKIALKFSTSYHKKIIFKLYSGFLNCKRGKVSVILSKIFSILHYFRLSIGYNKMNEITLPPSPNWYLSNIFACSKRGTIAWGSRNYIVIAKQEKTNNILQYTLLKEFSKTKVCSLAFCPKINNPDDSDCPELLICGGDDDKIKIWNIDKLDVLIEFDFSDVSSRI